MSYEVSPLSETPNPAAPTTAPIMREPKEVDPYRFRSGKPTATVPRETIESGQTNINSEAKGLEEPKETLTTEETVKLAPAMAALARKEQKFRLQQEELKKRTTELEREKLEIADLRALKQKLEAKDYSGIENLVKYDEYTNYLIEKESGVSPEAEKLRQLATEVEGVKNAQKEDVAKRFEAAVNERRRAVTQLVQSNAEFSSIKELKLEEAVVQHILQTWEHDNIDLSPEEAAKEIEKELLERANKWSALSKLKAQSQNPEVQGDTKQLPPLKSAVKTITNNITASGEIRRPIKPLSQMSDQERYAEARRRAEEKLKLQGKI